LAARSDKPWLCGDTLNHHRKGPAHGITDRRVHLARIN
jgi:hypothetical protein